MTEKVAKSVIRAMMTGRSVREHQSAATTHGGKNNATAAKKHKQWTPSSRAKSVHVLMYGNREPRVKPKDREAKISGYRYWPITAVLVSTYCPYVMLSISAEVDNFEFKRTLQKNMLEVIYNYYISDEGSCFTALLSIKIIKVLYIIRIKHYKCLRTLFEGWL